MKISTEPRSPQAWRNVMVFYPIVGFWTHFRLTPGLEFLWVPTSPHIIHLHFKSILNEIFQEIVSQTFTSVFAVFYWKLMVKCLSSDICFTKNYNNVSNPQRQWCLYMNSNKTKTNKPTNNNNCHESDKFEKDELGCYSHISERKKKMDFPPSSQFRWNNEY